MPARRPIESPKFIERAFGKNKLSKTTIGKLKLKSAKEKRILKEYNDSNPGNIKKVLTKIVSRQKKINDLNKQLTKLQISKNPLYKSVLLILDELEKLKKEQYEISIAELERENAHYKNPSTNQLIDAKYKELRRRLKAYNFRKGIYEKK